MCTPQVPATAPESMEIFVLRLLANVDPAIGNMKMGDLLEAADAELKARATREGRNPEDVAVQLELKGELERLLEDLQDRNLILDLGGYVVIQDLGRARLNAEHTGSPVL